MKFPKPFRKSFDRSDDIAAINQRFEAAEKLADPAEQLLQFQQLAEDSYALCMDVCNKAGNVTIPPAIGGVALIVGGAFMLNPFVIGAGVVTAAGFMFASRTVADDTMQAAGKLCRRTQAAFKALRKDPPMAGIAASPQFDKVMQQFPDLKEKFLLAASRQKFLDTLPAPKPGKDGPGLRL